jgi:hypothetical protein
MVDYISIALLCSLVGGAIGVLTFTRNKAKEDRSEGHQHGQMYAELGYIKSGIDDIKTEQREQRQFNTETATKLATVEASVRQAHLRLDRLEGRDYPATSHE